MGYGYLVTDCLPGQVQLQQCVDGKGKGYVADFFRLQEEEGLELLAFICHP